MISDIIYRNDACFFIEHWLNTQEKYLFEEICKNEYNIIYHSDYDTSNGVPRGRPHGGLCWVIHKKFNLVSQTIYNQSIIKAVITSQSKTFNLYGAWLPFDNGKKESLALFKSNLSLLESQVKLDGSDESIILGDFNADLTRGNRFDKLLVKFVEKNLLVDSLDVNSQNVNHTYRKGE